MGENIHHSTGDGPASGVRFLHTLSGPADQISRLAWSPDGKWLAAGSKDGGVRLWDADQGGLVREWRGHEKWVYSVAFDPTGRFLASAGADRTIKIWTVESDSAAEPLRSFGAHRDTVFRVAWSPDGRWLASGSADNRIRIWDTTTWEHKGSHTAHYAGINDLAWSPDGKQLASGSFDQWIRVWNIGRSGALGWDRVAWQIHGHSAFVSTVAWSPDGAALASGSDDKTIEIIQSASRQRRVLEGHTASITSVAFSHGQTLFASRARDGTIRLWRGDRCETVAVIDNPSSDWWVTGLTFHPTLPRLAAVGSAEGAPTKDSVIHLWELDEAVLLGRAAPQSVTYTSAKILLVGDTGVGKTGLGWRLAHGDYQPSTSTHGQQFWPLKHLDYARGDGVQCEAVLWDLAGQPDYRLVHALFLDNTDLALVLYDASRNDDPLRGVEFWLKQFAPPPDGGVGGGAAARPCPVILVASRSDRGAPRLMPDAIEAFCRERGIAAHLATSASTGEGVPSLVERMKELIAWDEKRATVTTETFKRIKDEVLDLKEKAASGKLIFTPEELREHLARKDPRWHFADEEMMTAVGHLANHGYVARLKNSRGEPLVLVAPETLRNLASSFVLKARANPDGLGSLDERALASNQYDFPELRDIHVAERGALLDAAAALFLEHNVCFRETDPLTTTTYLVFPELINLQQPATDDRQPTEEGVAYTIVGAVENVYASLVVLLGYTQTFTRRNQWRHHARYEVGKGHVCGFRQQGDEEGRLEFVLYFGVGVDETFRRLFQSLFESFLKRRNLAVVRHEIVTCPQGHRLHREVMRQQKAASRNFAFCAECGDRVDLTRVDQQIQLTNDELGAVERDRRVTQQRKRFERSIFYLTSYVEKRMRPQPKCFISYAWGDEEQERWVEHNLAKDLLNAGLKVVLDRWENARIGAGVPLFVESAGESEYILVVGTPAYLAKYANSRSVGNVVSAEIHLVGTRMLGDERTKESVLPVLLAGTEATSFPHLLRGRVRADFTVGDAYFEKMLDLVLTMHKIPPTDPVAIETRRLLRGNAE